jgi:thioredoxin 1
MKSKFDTLISSETPVLIDFYADWCGPCKMMPPILKELKNSMGDKIKIVKIDTEKNQPLSSQLGIRSIPTLMIFQNGKEVWRQAGVVQAAQLESQLKTFLN